MRLVGLGQRRAGRNNAPPVLSVVIPFHDEEAGIGPLLDRLVPVLDGTGLPWELVCVNDGSNDATLLRLIEAHRRRRNIHVVDLSRNFGKEIALSAGLAHSTGRAVVTMDADLQHPPETIAELIAKWQEGYEVVYATRIARVGQSRLDRAFARGFYWLFDRLSGMALPREAGDFRLLDRKVVDVINAMPERGRFMKGIFTWVGFRQVGVPYRQAERAHGSSKWRFLKLVGFAFDGLTAFSNFPLRIWGGIGAAIALTAFAYAVFRVIRAMVYGVDVPGYESTLVAILFLGGVQLLTLGILGDYLGRVFNEVKGRPLYIVRAVHGREEQPELPHILEAGEPTS